MRSMLSAPDKLCLAAAAVVLIASIFIYKLTDSASLQAVAVEEGKFQTEIMVFYGETPDAPLLSPAVNDTPLIAPILQENLYDESIPLDWELQEVLREACEEHCIPLCLVLGLIEVESNFDPDADNGVSVGLMQLNTRYYPSDLTPEENIRAGVTHLAGQIERYGGNIQAALRSYNRGYDDGDRKYATAVLNASEKWGCG